MKRDACGPPPILPTRRALWETEDARQLRLQSEHSRAAAKARLLRHVLQRRSIKT